MMSIPNFYARAFALAVVLALSYLLAQIFAPFVGSMLWAAFLAFLLHPIYRNLRRRFGNRAGLAAGVLTGLTPVVVLLPLVALSLAFISQVSQLLRVLQDSAVRWDIKGLADLQQIPLIGSASGWLQAHAPVSAEQIQTWLIGGAKEILQKAAGLGGSVFLGAVGSLIGFMLMLFLLFFFLRDGERIVARGRNLIPLAEQRKERLFSDLGAVTRAIVYGTSMTALLQGLMVGIGFAITGLASPVVFGVLAAVLAMLPVGGTALVWVPASLWLYATGRWGWGTFMLVWGLVLSSLDNILKPLIISGRATISTLAVFLGVLGGIAAFGAIGLVVGPIVLSLTVALVQFAEEMHIGAQPKA
jgi:predicted PurR-regulated permease PerM